MFKKLPTLPRLGLDKYLKAVYKKYERVFIPGFLVIGFAFDVFTFKTLQIDTTLALLFAYAVVAGAAFVFIHAYDAQPQPPASRLLGYVRFLAPFITQLSFGALLSSALLFYWFSGSLSVSWPLFALTVGVMISSEVFRKWYLHPRVQLGVYNFVLLSYFSVLLPFVLQSLNSWIFILGGVISTLIVLLIVLLTAQLSTKFKSDQPKLLLAVLSVFVVMSGFYFLKLIPPIPLSIREAGIYRDIIRRDGEYELMGRDESFWQQLIPGQTIQASPTDDIYAYTAIFAPTDLTAEIYHRWEYHDPSAERWIQHGLFHFSIRGGRPEGYRGYTRKSNTAPGRWRVSVENDRGQVLGRLTFKVLGLDYAH